MVLRVEKLDSLEVDAVGKLDVDLERGGAFSVWLGHLLRLVGLQVLRQHVGVAGTLLLLHHVGLALLLVAALGYVLPPGLHQVGHLQLGPAPSVSPLPPAPSLLPHLPLLVNEAVAVVVHDVVPVPFIPSHVLSSNV